VFVPDKLFQPSLMFAGEARSLSTSVAHESAALLANIRLGWKSLPGTNALAYYENLSITDKKVFITLASGAKVTKRFFFVSEVS
jgi:hypothetical protein